MFRRFTAVPCTFVYAQSWWVTHNHLKEITALMVKNAKYNNIWKKWFSILSLFTFKSCYNILVLTSACLGIGWNVSGACIIKYFTRPLALIVLQPFNLSPCWGYLVVYWTGHIGHFWALLSTWNMNSLENWALLAGKKNLKKKVLSTF